MTTNYGEISWSDDSYTDKKDSNKKDLFLRLEEGDNEVRLLTQPYQYLVHKIKKDPNNPKDFGQKVNCSAIHGSCPACDLNDTAKARWLLGIISRKTETYKILDISFAVFSQIRKLAKNVKSWGDPTKYDLNIVVDKNGGAIGYYSVQAISKEPLSAAAQQIRDNIDLDDLKRRVTPPTPELVQKRLDSIFEGGTPPNLSKKTNLSLNVKPSSLVHQPVTNKVAVVSMTDDEEEFPDYDA